MEGERNEFNRSSEENIISSPCSSRTSIVDISGKSIEKSCLTVIDPQFSNSSEVSHMTNVWLKVFKENARIGSIKLFTVVIRCFDIDIENDELENFDSDLMCARIIKIFKILDKNGLLCSPETIKRSAEVLKTLELITSIFQHHSDLFFTDDTIKVYFYFLKNILIKISQSNFIGPRYLATSFGLKIITGLILFNNFDLVGMDLNLLLKEFVIKRWKDTTFKVRETVLLEINTWIKFDLNYFLKIYWIYLYEALSDQSTILQNLALEISTNLLSFHFDNRNVKMLIKKVATVLPNMLLSKNEEVVMSAFKFYCVLPSSYEEDDEQSMSKINSIAKELMFSEKFKIAQIAAKHFVEQTINVQPNEFEKLKVIVSILHGIVPDLMSIATSHFVDAIYDSCSSLLTNFELISKILNLDNYFDDLYKHNLMHLLTFIIQRSVTGSKPDYEFANMGNQNEVTQLHVDILKKKEFTIYIAMHVLNQLQECNDPLLTFSLWVLIQFFDFELLQETQHINMILPKILNCASSFYRLITIPTILEMVSKCIFIMTSVLKGDDNISSLNIIQHIAVSNIDVLKAGVEDSSENVPSLLNQKNALIKMWSLAKYNNIPNVLEPLKYLSYYIPNLNNTQVNLVVSAYALNAYMEILKKQLLKEPNNLHIENLSESSVETTFLNFLDSMLNILNKYDPQVINLCETAYLIVDELLRIKCTANQKVFTLSSDQSSKLTNFIFCVCRNYKNEDDVNSSKLLEMYLQLIQDGVIDINHLLTPLQFVNKGFIEHALQPIFNFFCKKETGSQLSNVINLYMVYLFENIIFEKPAFKNFDVMNTATIITRLLNQCTDVVGKRLVSTNIHRNGIQYAMSDVLNESNISKTFFWVLAAMCDTLVSYDAQRLYEFFLNKPSTLELINSGNESVLAYFNKLEKLFK